MQKIVVVSMTTRHEVACDKNEKININCSTEGIDSIPSEFLGMESTASMANEEEEAQAIRKKQANQVISAV
jgi:hypothetical protein